MYDRKIIDKLRRQAEPFFLGISNNPTWSYISDLMDDNPNFGGDFPPHDLIRNGDNTTQIRVAVAGYEKDQINLSVEDGVLKITGSKAESSDALDAKVIYQGISRKAFTKTFRLNDNMLIENAKMSDGILTIDIREEIPDNKKSTTIPIS